MAPQEEPVLTPPDIGVRLGGRSAVAVNSLLQERGLQLSAGAAAKIVPYWQPTDAGRAHAVFLDTGKRHSDGTPVWQLKWGAGVVDVLTDVAAPERSACPVLAAAPLFEAAGVTFANGGESGVKLRRAEPSRRVRGNVTDCCNSLSHTTAQSSIDALPFSSTSARAWAASTAPATACDSACSMTSRE